MKKAFAVLALAATVAACDSAPTEPGLMPQLARNGAQQSVTGHIENDLSQFDIPFEKYSFSAIRHADGSVSGRFQVFTAYPDGAFKLQGEVTCMTIAEDGRTARMAGVVTHSNVPDISAGDGATWTVYDDGEGRNAVDRASDLIYGYPPTSPTPQRNCDIGIIPPYSESMKGNVQVRP